MKILLCSHWFQPSVGGVETVSRLLAEAFATAGAQVTIVTQTPATSAAPEAATGSKVLRRPSVRDLLYAGQQCDVIFQNHVSLQTLLPLTLLRKPTVIAHQSWLRRSSGEKGWQNQLKLLAIRTGTNVAISQAIADTLPVPAQVIPNPFESNEFLPFHDMPRTRDIVFVGRLVSDKGCDLLLEALGRLRARTGHIPTTTIIGDGPDRPALQALASKLGLEQQVTFAGTVLEGRGALMAQHRIQVVPSRWNEPFGIVGVEGVASGCAMLVSAGGGLPEAVGSCGLLFPNGNVEALTAQLERLLNDPSLCAELVSHGPAHVDRFRPERVAAEYLACFERALHRRAHSP